ncbi:hypothetical protein C7M61_004053 [Candidozyma pseudohaemuli]|uniref:Uncharacterized protein n=1 Tax=Candidozyma pseudohaemuli TaxID=418784 RepID=A0A2P7YJT9_9ASCO|nr:hypothetical protein C7M61_004053 [[Candida] pseudohaemulonii]PSK36233.1 hypothetical protein C7M61_004053 [[Candida] pseudohaemulonii]
MRTDGKNRMGYEEPDLPTPSSEIWIGELTDYRRALRLDHEEYASIIVYDYDTSSTARYLFYVIFHDRRPYWQLLVRDGILRCYDIINSGGDFKEINFPGFDVRRDPKYLSRLH